MSTWIMALIRQKYKVAVIFIHTKNISNFEAFLWNISLNAKLLFLKSDSYNIVNLYARNVTIFYIINVEKPELTILFSITLAI